MTATHHSVSPLRAKISDDGKWIALNYMHHHIARIRGVAGATYDKKSDRWRIPLTWTSCVALYLEFGDEFEVDSALNDWGMKERELRVGPAEELRDKLSLDGLITTFKTDPSTEIAITALEFADSVQKDLSLTFHDYQVAGAAFLAVVERGMLLDQLGVGKTAQAIAALQVMQAVGKNPYPALIVCPASVKQVWVDEFAKWNPDLTVVNVKGEIGSRRLALETPAHIYVMSYAVIGKHAATKHYPGSPARRKCVACGGFDPAVTHAQCQVHPKELNAMPFRTVLADEAHRLINPRTQWTQALWSVSDEVPYRFALTGTPIQDNLEDFWALLRFVAPLEFPAKNAFLDRYAEMGFSPWGVREVLGIKPAHALELAAITKPFYRRTLKAAVLSFLPPVFTERRVIGMTGAQGKAYRDMVKTMVADLEDTTGTVIAASPLTRATRLMQFASSYAEVIVEPDGSEKVKLHEPSNKIAAFFDDIPEYESEAAGVIVFAQSAQLIELLSAKMTLHGIKHYKITGAVSEGDRADAIRGFQAGDAKYILLTSAGGAGVTLTAADTMVFLQRASSSTVMDQALGRVHRIGSERHDSVRIIHYLSEGTIESKQLEALAAKHGRMEEIFNDREQLLKILKAKGE